MHPRHHGADGRVHGRRGLPVAEALDVDEVDSDPELFREQPERRDDLVSWHPSKSLLFGEILGVLSVMCQPVRAALQRQPVRQHAPFEPLS